MVWPPMVALPRFAHQSLGPGTLPYRGVKRSYCLVKGLFPYVGITCPISDSEYSFVLLMCMYHMTHGQFHYYIQTLQWEDRVLLLEHEKGVLRPIALNQLLGGYHWPWNTVIHYWSQFCFVFFSMWVKLCLSGTWLHCVFLVNPIPRCSGQMCFNFYFWWLA